MSDFLSKLDKSGEIIAAAENIDEASQLVNEFDAVASAAKKLNVSKGVQVSATIAQMKARANLARHYAAVPDDSGKRTDLTSLPQGNEVTPKQRALAAAGISNKTMSKYMELMKLDDAGRIDDLQAEWLDSLPEDPNVTMGLRKLTGKEEKHVHVAQNSGYFEWYTPKEYVDLARAVMGGFDLDPASSPLANETVQANHIFTEEEDGLAHPWFGRVWVNPPYAAGVIDKWAEKIVAEYESGNVAEAITITNNGTETRWCQKMLSTASAICLLRGRVQFWSTKEAPNSPLQGQVVCYFGDNPGKFCEVFRDAGVVFGTQ